jgi:hypothetical protein
MKTPKKWAGIRRRVSRSARATPRGPRNSEVTASPRPIRPTAVYSDRFIAAKTRARDSTGHHSGQVNRRTWGRPTIHSRTPATHAAVALASDLYRRQQ